MLKNKKEFVMIIRKIHIFINDKKHEKKENKENKDEVRGGEEEGCFGINR